MKITEKAEKEPDWFKELTPKEQGIVRKCIYIDLGEKDNRVRVMSEYVYCVSKSKPHRIVVSGIVQDATDVFLQLHTSNHSTLFVYCEKYHLFLKEKKRRKKKAMMHLLKLLEKK